ncbi:hypothetical protein ANCDUO_17932 [Ancylostoma duodenale]|uniref:PABS domain-containing protein n=1 Tax=Ancylostoma duodenale TaxID=51022 RepID=A0A0C2C6Q5_9BILA|nr:hypothetical protein ANCDUO_17932 [Ancylostoma duodenale]
MMVGMGFVMEALSFEPKSMQQMLMIGLGGGVINNFLSTLGPEAMINLTTVELDPEVFSLALDWFHLVETPTNRVVIGDGIEFIREASRKGDKYKVILVDACFDEIRPVCCPVEGFIDPETIENIGNILDEDGILSINVLTSGKGKGAFSCIHAQDATKPQPPNLHIIQIELPGAADYNDLRTLFCHKYEYLRARGIRIIRVNAIDNRITFPGNYSERR